MTRRKPQPILSSRVPQALIDHAAILFTAVAIYFLWPYRHLILLIGIIVLAVRFWLWVCRAHPFVAIFVAGFIRGLTGRR